MNLMNSYRNPRGASTLLSALAAVALSTLSSQAHPYASGVTNNAGTITFILNESADNVKVVFDNGTSTNSLGALAKGGNSFALGLHTNFAIIVAKSGSGVPSQIGTPPGTGSGQTTNVDFNGPRGVAVNNNPQRPTFGLVYVANGSPGNHLRPVGKGIYVLNADCSDAFGYGTNAMPPKANFPNAGANWWGSSTTYSPYRLFVGSDDTLYVGDSSYATSYTPGDAVWMMDPALTNPTPMFAFGTSSLNGSACQSKPFVTGSLATGDLTLTCMMWGYVAPNGTYGSVLRYNIGSGPIDLADPWTMAPSVVVSNSQPGATVVQIQGVACDLFVATNGYIYVTWPRANNGGVAAGANDLWVYDSAGDLLWASSVPGQGGVSLSGGAPTNDCFVAKSINLAGVAVSHDGQYLAAGNAAAANFCLVKLTNGIPDVSTIATYAAPNAINRSVAFDLANNLYTVEGNSDSVRIYSLGLTTTCVTSNDWTCTNGGFQLLLPPTTVSVATSTPQASQGSPTPVPGVFTITRVGQLSQPLTVGFSLGGTATNGTYTASATTSVTLATGQASTNVTITPVNDGVPRRTTTVVLNLSSGTNYSAAAPVSATITIQNTATPQLVVSAAAATAYKSFPADYASFTVTRLGNTNVAAFGVSSFTYAGTAVPAVDFVTAQPVTLNPGAITAIGKVFPLDPTTNYTGDKTIVVGLTSGTGYTAATNTATLTILDNANPPATVLWSNPLTDPADASNWNVTWVTKDGSGPDYFADFGYDLTSGGPSGLYGVIPLPPSGATTALRLTYNKVHGISGAVNLYPTNVSFSGDYAVRFSMYLVQGSSLGSATEGAMFGINHDGMETNWFGGSSGVVGGPWSSDGVWYWVSCDAGQSGFGDYAELTGAANGIPNTGWNKLNTASYTATANVFKNPAVFTAVNSASNAVPGMPANASPFVVTTPGAWADVEVKQVRNVVTLTIDKTSIFTYTNTMIFTNGTIMLAYEDPYDSLGTPEAGVYYSNLRVVRLASPSVIQIAINGANVVINFTSLDGDDSASSFVVQSAVVAGGPFTDVSPAAAITQLGTGAFQAVVPLNGPVRFYRIRHL